VSAADLRGKRSKSNIMTTADQILTNVSGVEAEVSRPGGNAGRPWMKEIFFTIAMVAILYGVA
jgi:hypothetical protein